MNCQKSKTFKIILNSREIKGKEVFSSTILYNHMERNFLNVIFALMFFKHVTMNIAFKHHRKGQRSMFKSITMAF